MATATQLWEALAKGIGMSLVFTHLAGGLGNQLFQYAAARALALRRNAQVVLFLKGYEKPNQSRRYELDVYPHSGRQMTASERLAARLSWKAGPRISRLFADRLGLLPFFYRERHYHFNEAMGKQPLPLLLRGFWQSERYFADAADVIRRELVPCAPVDPANIEMAKRIAAAEAVSLHVRRGDYVTDKKANTEIGVCSLTYYRDAIAHVRERTTSQHLFVFSDDPEWARTNLRADLPVTYLTINTGDRGFRDLQLMSMCRHHIIANSSFSWWGAWLNPSPAKIVVAPKVWFAGLPHDTTDLIPQEWVRL
jgi:hypothetical protein